MRIKKNKIKKEIADWEKRADGIRKRKKIKKNADWILVLKKKIDADSWYRCGKRDFAEGLKNGILTGWVGSCGWYLFADADDV